MARPTKFTPERRERFVLAIGSGAFPETAARHAGWSPATWYRIQHGQSPEHRTFLEEVDRVATELELRLVGTVTLAAYNDARLALALLERRFRSRWGRSAAPTEPAEPADPPAAQGEVVVLDPALVEVLVPKLLAARTGVDASTVGSVRRFENRPPWQDSDR